MKSSKSIGLALLALVAICLSAPAAWSTPMVEISYVETDLGGGAWQYNFTFANASNTGEGDLYDVFMTFNDAFSSTEIVVPEPASSLLLGWTGVDYAAGIFVFYSQDPPGIPSDIAPGFSLGGFIIKSIDRLQVDVTPPQFEAKLWVGDGIDPNLCSGPISPSTTPVPEPSTLLLLGGGLLGMLVIARLREIRA